ncbi:GNAT family N-acetyltransferase [Lactiplantibacillus plantarum]|nr:GNAT family N-acetyltransferase [Lactiplantibacillus plantarum]
MLNFKTKIGNFDYLRASSCYVRMKVFVFERNLNIEDEFDSNDRESTIYSVIFKGNQPVSTARLLPIDKEMARITRVATLKEYRGEKLGSENIDSLEKIAKKRNFSKILIHSEVTAVKFYEKNGYVLNSSIYKEDGVDCVSLVKNIK